eukprot:Plantae.Rhodophyta-Palmaria_palmata.ctg2467.p1 GENE.Plantae.Rhodophyta-Palmaria_palmata.ctg2467~~Plantae.Rhodophyta-Palmaria_palmata.ctg2467.p1  ORF type:complete len:374 (+),score=33.25 Plantae.Rhodophyta-Palmaria_palmata.ctg2467:537-1658(+)
MPPKASSAILSVLAVTLSVYLCGVEATPTQRQASSSASCNITHVCVVIDQSGSINNAEYAEEQQFVNLIAAQIKGINPDVLLSAVAFSTSAQQIQAPTPDLATFTGSVNQSRLFRGSTYMSRGLQECRVPLTPLAGSRIIVLVTDGQPTDRLETISEANLIKDEPGMYLVTYGIGLGLAGNTFLEDIAQAPEFSLSSNFDMLPSMVTEVVESICSVPSLDTDCESASAACLFTFAGAGPGIPEFDVQPKNPDSLFTPVIVSKDPTQLLGVLNTNDIIPEFIIGGEAKNITEFGKQNFTPTHFKPFWNNEAFGSGIGHQTFQSDQAEAAKGKCVRIYFSHFQALRNVNGSKIVVENRNKVPKSENVCVVFRTAA